MAGDARDGRERMLRPAHWLRVREDAPAPRSDRAPLGLLRDRRLGAVQRPRHGGRAPARSRHRAHRPDIAGLLADDGVDTARSAGATSRWLAMGIRDAGHWPDVR